jgi:hypothetical protein
MEEEDSTKYNQTTETNLEKRRKKNSSHRIRCDESRHSVGHIKLVLGSGPDNLHRLHIELRRRSLVRQVIDPLHFFLLLHFEFFKRQLWYTSPLPLKSEK